MANKKSPTAPEVTEKAVSKAETFDCVSDADNYKEWMYVEYKEDTTEEERERVETHFSRRLVPNDKEVLENDGLELDPENTENVVVYYLEPANW